MRFGLGFSYTPVTNTTTSFRSNGKLGESVEMLFGGTPWQGVVLGGGFLGIGIDASFPLVAYAAFVQYYPDPQKGFHLQALGAFAIQADQSDLTGPVVAAGAGYDGWVGGQTSLGAFARIGYASMSGVPRNTSSTSSLGPETVRESSAFFMATFTFTWH
jgi:hypothetical protein